MKSLSTVLLLLLGACAHFGLGGRSSSERLQLWDAAHQAFAATDFARADSLFGQLARNFPASVEGRESLFYLGAMRIDPRNPEWDPEPAEARLRSYLAADTAADVEVHRRPEAHILLELARQLNLPAEDRIGALRPTVRTRVVERPVPARRVTRATDVDAMARQMAELRAQLAARDREVNRLQEELERIRKTLTGRRQN